MATPNTLTRELNDLLSTTLENYQPTMADNIYRGNALLAWLRDNDGQRPENGGSKIMAPLMYGKNDTIKAYEGYDKIDTSPQEGMTQAEFDWRQIAGSISISRKERRINSGEAALFNLVDKKVQQAEMSMKEKVNEFILNSFDRGDDGKQITPLTMLVAKDPSAASWNPVGGITGEDWDFWRNQAASSTATTLTELKHELFHEYNSAGRGTGGVPDLGITDQETHEMYEMALQDQKRYRNDDAAQLGFPDNIMLKQATLIWDEIVPNVQAETTYTGSEISSGSLWFLNTDFIELVVDTETDFRIGEFKEPPDQDAAVAKILWMGELVVNNRRKHGVVYDIDRLL